MGDGRQRWAGDVAISSGGNEGADQIQVGDGDNTPHARRPLGTPPVKQMSCCVIWSDCGEASVGEQTFSGMACGVSWWCGMV